MLFLIAPNERQLRVEVGPGLQDRLTDALSSMVIRDTVVPRLKAGDLPGGVVAGTDALIAQLQADPNTAQANLATAQAAPRATHRSGGGGHWVWLVIVLLWLFFSVFRGRSGRSSGIGNAVLWGVASGMFNDRGRGGWGGGGGWSGGDGGGFSGGGGSADGGGASGSW